MKVSRAWLQRYFESELPSAEVIADALTFHAFEIESVEGDVLDVKVLPDRAGYALSHRGIAKEVSAILSLPLKRDPLRVLPSALQQTDQIHITLDERYVLRHLAVLIEGVRVQASPEWLTRALESVGQRSINNIVDATNFVMLDIGQPMHAFDADYIRGNRKQVHLDIRASKTDEKVTTLSGETYALSDNMYVIANGATGEALDIAGVKGGLLSGVKESTKNIVLSVGTYDGELVRKACQRLSIFTDASQRYQNRPSPELGAYGMKEILTLILEVAGGTLVGGIDIYPAATTPKSVTISAAKTTRLLGASYTDADIVSALTRLDLPFIQAGETFTVTPPFERTDIAITEDLIEEVGRLIGYEHVQPLLLSTEKPSLLPQSVATVELMRDALIEEGCIEISSYSMVSNGDVLLQKPLAEDKKYLRPDLYQGHAVALESNAPHMALYNLVDLKLFEIGRVWPKGEERMVLGVSYRSSAKDGLKKRDAFFNSIEAKISSICGVPVSGLVSGDTWQCDLGASLLSSRTATYTIREKTLDSFSPFSSYPYALRDIAVWTPEGTEEDAVHALIQKEAGNLLVRSDLHDVFTKDGRTSYMFKLVLQAFDRTLTDSELTEVMQRITSRLNEQKGFSVR